MVDFGPKMADFGLGRRLGRGPKRVAPVSKAMSRNQTSLFRADMWSLRPQEYLRISFFAARSRLEHFLKNRFFSIYPLIRGSSRGHVPPPHGCQTGFSGPPKNLFFIYSSTAPAADPGTFITPPNVGVSLPHGTKTGDQRGGYKYYKSDFWFR